MKRVLVLNVDSFVGKEVCRRFYEAKDYLIDGTLYHQTGLRLGEEPSKPLCDPLAFPPSTTNACSCVADSSTLEVPAELHPFLNAVIPRHREISDEEFRLRVVTYDIIIAILEDDAFEADCAIKVLRGTHYEVEKTFVLVSNVFTWAQTDAHEYELQRAARRAERDAARALEADDDDDPEAASEEEEEEEEEMATRVWSEEDYRQRYPDVRYSVWRQLEHAVKHANSETLHTYVLWAGLPYGSGEDLLAPYFYNAWYHKKMLQYGDGSNHIPTIHVYDLSRIIYLVGSSYDTLEDRYMFAVDQGNNTQAEILQGIQDFIGGVVEITSPEIDRKNQVKILPKQPPKEPGKEPEKIVIPSKKTESTEIKKEREALFKLGRKERMVSDEVRKEILVVEGLAQREMMLQASLTQYEKSFAGDNKDSSGAKTGAATYEEGLVVASPHGLANWFSAVDVRCVPGAVISLLEEDDWVSLGGFFANVDKVVQEFKKKRQLHPMRLILSGPPCSKKTDVAIKLAKLFSITHLTLENVTSAYEAHVAAIRAEMVDILVRRRLRRHEAREERQRREEERVKLERAARSEEEEKEEEEGEENDEEGEDEGDEEEERGEEDGTGEEEDETGETKKVEPDVTMEEQIRQSIKEAELLQVPEDEEEEEYNEDDEEIDEKTAVMRQKIDEAERRRIATLREEYRFATRLLTLRLVNGEFPPLPKRLNVNDEEEEEEEEEEDVTKGRQHKKKDVTPIIADELPPTIRYLDEAIAVMMRWRLRQDDCRNQGYILESFPETVRQAWLMFMADTDEQKEMQRPRLRRETDEEENPKPILDAKFPLPDLYEIDNDRRREILDAVKGKTFLSAEEALVPTHEGFFPDCFIFLTGSEALIRAHMSEESTSSKANDKVLGFYDEFTHFMTHHNPNAPPTESLLSWFQTVVVEKVENDATENDDAEGVSAGETLPRKACVLFLPLIIGSPPPVLSNETSEAEGDEVMAYCNFIRWTVLKNVGYDSCGPVIEAMHEDEEERMRRWMEVRFEWMVLEKLRVAEELFAAVTEKIETEALEEERRVLRFYEAKEVFTSVAGVDSVPADIYLMRYVLPSLTPLMAEVVRMRPEDPVAVLADALFHHKRQVSL